MWSTLLLPLLLTSASASRGPQHWVDKGNGLPKEAITAVAVDPFNDKIIYAGLDGALYVSTDAGDSFAPVLSFPRGLPDDAELAADVSSADTDVGGDDEVDDDDEEADEEDAEERAAELAEETGEDVSVDDLPEGDVDEEDVERDVVTGPSRFDPGVRALAFVPQTPGSFYVATPRGLWRTNNSGRSFDRVFLPGSGRENDVRDVIVDPRRPSRVLIATAAGLFLSKDGAASLQRVSGRLSTTPSVCLAAQGDTILIGTERGLVKTRDGGDSFTDLLLSGEAAYPLIHAVAVAGGGATLYAGVERGLFVAARGSAILEHYDGMPTEPATAISPDPLESDGLVLATRAIDGGGGAFASSDIGLTMTQIEPVPANHVLALSRETKDSARVWAGTDRGLFRLVPGTGIRVSSDELVALRERFKREPPLDELIDRAHAHQRIDIDMENAMARAGWAAILPRLDASYRFDAGDADQARAEVIFVTGIGAPPTSDPTAPQTDQFGNGFILVQPSQRIEHRALVTLTWDLDRLVFYPQTPTLSRNASIVIQNRITLADAVRDLYVTRRRLVTQVVLAEQEAKKQKKKQTSAQQLRLIHKELEILEVEARLAGLVGDDVFDTVEQKP